MSEPKLYPPGVWATLKTAPFWKLEVQCSKAAELIEFIKAHTDARGRIHFCITELRERKERQTHSVWLDTWRPDAKGGFQAAKDAAAAAPQPPREPNDDVPF